MLRAQEFLVIVVLALAWSGASPASAQRHSRRRAPEPEPRSAPAVVAQSPATEAPIAAPPAVSTEARAHLDRGEQLFGAGGFDAALAEYQAAFAAMDGHPSQYLVLFNIAQCHERLSHYDLALTYYRQYLDGGGANEADAAEVRARLEVLEGLLGTVEITLTWPQDAPTARRPTVEVWLGERNVGTAPGELRLPGGNHAIEVRAPGYEPQMQTVALASQQRRSVTFEMRATASGGLTPAVFWGSTIASGLALIAGGSLGVYALVRHDELASLAPSQEVLRTQGDLDNLRGVALAADVLFGTAALFGVASLILYFATNWAGDDAAPEGATATSRLHVAPWGSPDGAGLQLSGAF